MQALQQARASGLIAQIPQLQPALCTTRGFSSFCSWLPQHSGLISKIWILDAPSATDPSDPSDEERHLMTHLLQLALQASTARVPDEAAPPPLQLQEFLSGGINVTPVLLSAVARTQPLGVQLRGQLQELTAAACAALGTLRSVRALLAAFAGLVDEQQAATRCQELCRLLQVSSAVRRAVQQARGGCSVQHRASPCAMLRFSSFCSWLLQHSGLISSVQIIPAPTITAEHSQVMAHMLQTALLASTGRVPGDGEAAAPPLQLQKFSSGGITISPVLLSALARTQPQQVDIHVQHGELTAAACAALGTLRSVTALSVCWQAPLNNQQAATRLQDLCAGIGQLTKLTRLSLQTVHPPGLQLLPASLQHLTLGMPEAAAKAAGAQLDPAHLTALTELSIQSGSAQVQLPSGVSFLDVLEGSIRLTGPHMPLHVHLVDASSSDLLILQDLSRQQQPWSLELCVWSLELDCTSVGFDPAAGAALSACTSLTALIIWDESRGGGSLPWARHVAALQGLRQLELESCGAEEQDLHMLTALTALTQLQLECEMSDTVAVVLACTLTGLLYLWLNGGRLQTAALLPAVAMLTGLQHLDLMPFFALKDSSCPGLCKAITPAALGYLSSLTQLTFLRLPLGEACPSEARRQLLDSMPGVRFRTLSSKPSLAVTR